MKFHIDTYNNYLKNDVSISNDIVNYYILFEKNYFLLNDQIILLIDLYQNEL